MHVYVFKNWSEIQIGTFKVDLFTTCVFESGFVFLELVEHLQTFNIRGATAPISTRNRESGVLQHSIDMHPNTHSFQHQHSQRFKWCFIPHKNLICSHRSRYIFQLISRQKKKNKTRRHQLIYLIQFVSHTQEYFIYGSHFGHLLSSVWRQLHLYSCWNGRNWC